ncbi:hypothetical protein DFH08DRAFT_963135 [Mycena albidolilacea]|uniref:O-methyltransferase C-terminal domain-containing protein n=1 Tax=Mycena albidolilacea TaxID=1033008 RepID=A0AAD6ZVF8_9AGAR|nr:hypothetical protein DFH08DRAFT_963135 [Mycena albidolilacea]
MTTAQKNPALRIINQDLEHQVEDAKIMTLEQKFSLPVKNATAFLLSYIMHNWPNARAASLLQNLRTAAQPTTQLVIIEKILSVAATPSADETSILGIV